jgi:hypothetical protein
MRLWVYRDAVEEQLVIDDCGAGSGGASANDAPLAALESAGAGYRRRIAARNDFTTVGPSHGKCRPRARTIDPPRSAGSAETGRIASLQHG